jgi:hypothetical protein
MSVSVDFTRHKSSDKLFIYLFEIIIYIYVDVFNIFYHIVPIFPASC